MKQVASLKYGVVFKKAFCDPEIFTAFAQDVIGLPVEVDHVETEKEFDPPVGYIKPRFDLFAEDRRHRVIVDIQHARTTDHYDRFLYYHCAALIEQIVKAQDYHPNLKVFTVVVLTSGDRHQRDISLINFDPHDLQGRPLHEIAHKVIYLCPKYVSEKTPEPCRDWLRAINDTLDEEVDETQYQQSAIQKLFDAIRRDQMSPDERARMIDEFHLEELQQTKFAEGQEAGKNVRQREIAAALLREGIAVDIVMKTTGLSQQEIVLLLDQQHSGKNL
ncbi:PD-(D/E)XK nuclease family transposase [Candidatus Electronema sp. JM]|uniref:PD-(D/E)XK nuclease family transposase n=1 Tax=Candidatus Electronema sp. JM TaxID=3401571 RepID=UPI003AA994D1